MTPENVELVVRGLSSMQNWTYLIYWPLIWTRVSVFRRKDWIAALLLDLQEVNHDSTFIEENVALWSGRETSGDHLELQPCQEFHRAVQPHG